jgi:hypothetical protein
MTIKRYDAHTNADDFRSDWHESKDGPMVKYEDYAALAAENTGLKAAIGATIEWQQSTDPENVASVQMLVYTKTPATEAFLDEVRAQGVEMVIAAKKHQKEIMHTDTFAYGASQESLRNLVDELELFAAQLRLEAAQ